MSTASQKPKEGSHVVSILLHPEKWQRDKLKTRFHMAKQAYNRTLDEWLKRRRKYHQHPLFQKAMNIDDDDERRKDLRWRAMEDVGFTETQKGQKISPSDMNKLFSGTDIAHHLSATILKTVGGFAVDAIWNWHKGHTEGKPSYKFDPPPLSGPNSIKLVDDDSSIRIPGPRGGADPLIIELSPKQLGHEKIQRSLSNRANYPVVMVTRKMVRGQIEYEAKVTCNGHAPLSALTEVNKGIVGVDVGPKRVAAVSEHGAMEVPIVDEKFYDEYLANLRRIQRKKDRQWRANNPEYYYDDGRIKPGPKNWHLSNNLLNTLDREKGAYRVNDEERKRQHYELCKEFLKLGNKFIVEDNDYRAWAASHFGRSINKAAPSMFIDRLEEKAVASGGWVRRISTWDTYLSSRCHCGRRNKKSLSQRVHRCECGVTAQRDLYSAFLARYVDEEGNLDEDRAQREWSSLEPAIQSASGENKSARDKASGLALDVASPETVEQIDWILGTEAAGGP